MPEQANPSVILETSKGPIKIALHADKAPQTVENFLKYVDDNYFDGTIFHRVIDNFMIQGGGFTPEMQQKPTGDPIENEADKGLKNARGTVAMARTSDPHSATSQFFINTGAANDFLNHSSKSSQGWGYCAFGEVVEGMDVVDQISGVETGRHGMHNDVPQEPIVIQSARRA
ncbi:MAG: peptidylprolyl isomerase [Bryobacterales bacterium]